MLLNAYVVKFLWKHLLVLTIFSLPQTDFCTQNHLNANSLKEFEAFSKLMRFMQAQFKPFIQGWSWKFTQTYLTWVLCMFGKTKQCLEEALQLWWKEHWTLLLASCSQASELKYHFSLVPKYTTQAPNPVLCSTMRLTHDTDTGKTRITKRSEQTILE